MELLQKLYLLEKEAEEFGFSWSDPQQIMQQIQSEQAEIAIHLAQKNHSKDLQEEIGDLLHASFSLCVFLNFDPKKTLEISIDKFAARLNMVKTIALNEGRTSLQGCKFDELMKYWDRAKQLLNTEKKNS